MGIEYYAINTQNKTFYDLGKGGWYALTDKEAFQDEEYLCYEILTECYLMSDAADDDYWKIRYTEQERKDIVEYIKNRVAPDLFQMMKDTPPDKIKIVNDCGDDIIICKAKRYRCVGTRYYELNSDSYVEAMKSLNRHLEDTPINKRWYNIESYKNIPGFNDY